MIRRSLPSSLLALMLLSAAYAVLGPPNPAAVVAFFAGGYPTIEDGEAVVGMISWAVIAAVAVLCIAGSLVALTRSAVLRQRSRRGVLVFVAGLLLITVAVIQRGLPSTFSLCCGDAAGAAQEAQTLGTR